MRIALTEKEIQGILTHAQEMMCEAARQAQRWHDEKVAEELSQFLLRTRKLDTTQEIKVNM
jgi:hypothetical protein